MFQLRDEGLLDLDDPVGRHVEELTVATPAIRALLSHASGLQREQPGDMWETMVMPGQDELVASLGIAERVIAGLALALLEPCVLDPRARRGAAPRACPTGRS